MRRLVLLLFIGLVFLSLIACTLSLQRTPPRKPIVLPTATAAPTATMAPLVPSAAGAAALPTVSSGAIQVPTSASGILDQVGTMVPGLPSLLGGKTATPTATATPTPKR